MSQTRLEKIGTIFTRVSGLIRAGSLKRSDRPLWYDVYEAFPPRLEPRLDRPVNIKPIRPIFYPEDTIRARFQREFGSPGTIQLRGTPTARPVTICDRFVEQYEAVRGVSPDLPENELYEAAVDALRAGGITLRRPGDSDPSAPNATAPGGDTAAGPEKELLRVADLFDEHVPTEKR